MGPLIIEKLYYVNYFSFCKLLGDADKHGITFDYEDCMEAFTDHNILKISVTKENKEYVFSGLYIYKNRKDVRLLLWEQIKVVLHELLEILELKKEDCILYKEVSNLRNIQS